MAKPLPSVVGPIFDLPILPRIQCHHATLYWLSMAQFEKAPSQGQLLEATNIIKTLAGCGTPLVRNAMVRPGTVLVFMNGAEPGHSCITISDTVLGGYNQQNWFGMSGPEADSQYTTYLLSQIRWKTDSTVQGNTAVKECRLIGINDVSALGNLAAAINQAVH